MFRVSYTRQHVAELQATAGDGIRGAERVWKIDDSVLSKTAESRPFSDREVERSSGNLIVPLTEVEKAPQRIQA